MGMILLLRLNKGLNELMDLSCLARCPTQGKGFLNAKCRYHNQDRVLDCHTPTQNIVNVGAGLLFLCKVLETSEI